MQRIQVELKKYRLKYAKNPIITQLRMNDWVYRVIKNSDLSVTPSSNSIYQDILNGRLQFKDNFVKTELNTKIQRGSLASDEGVKEFIRQMLFDKPRSQPKNYDVIYKKLEKSWRSDLPFLFKDAMQQALPDYRVEATPKMRIKYEKNQWRIITNLSDITLEPKKSSEVEPQILPGMITSYFVLTDTGFKLESLDINNPLLENICLNSRVEISSNILQQQALEKELENEIKDFLFKLELCDDNRKAPAEALLKEVFHLKKQIIDKPSIGTLTQIVSAAGKLIFADPQPNEIEDFRILATEVGQRSWGKILASLMLTLAGAALAIVSIVSLGVSLGMSAGPSAVGIIAGTGLVTAGGAGLFFSCRKKEIVKKMDVLVKAAEDPEYSYSPRQTR